MNESAPRTPVVAYLRRDTGEGGALGYQREALAEYARRNGLLIRKEQVEIASAGRGRALDRMLIELAEGDAQ